MSFDPNTLYLKAGFRPIGQNQNENQDMNPDLYPDLDMDPHTDSESGSFVVIPEYSDSEPPSSPKNYSENDDKLEGQAEVKGHSSEMHGKDEEKEVNQNQDQLNASSFKVGDWSSRNFMIWGSDSKSMEAVRFNGSEFSPSLADPTFRSAVDLVLEELWQFERDQSFQPLMFRQTDCCNVWWESKAEFTRRVKSSDFGLSQPEYDRNLVHVHYYWLQARDLLRFQEKQQSVPGSSEDCKRVEKMAAYCGLTKICNRDSLFMIDVDKTQEVKTATKAADSSSSSGGGGQKNEVGEVKGKEKEVAQKMDLYQHIITLLNAGRVPIEKTATQIIEPETKSAVTVKNDLNEVKEEKTEVMGQIETVVEAKDANDENEKKNDHSCSEGQGSSASLTSGQPQGEGQDVKNKDDWSPFTFTVWGRGSKSWETVRFRGCELSLDSMDPTFRSTVDQVLEEKYKNWSSCKATDFCVIEWKKSVIEDRFEPPFKRSDYYYPVKANDIQVTFLGLEARDLKTFQDVFSFTGGDASAWTRANLRVASRVENMARYCGIIKLGEQASSILQQLKSHKKMESIPNERGGARSISDIPKVGPPACWNGSIILKNGCHLSQLYLTDGNLKAVESLLKDEHGKNQFTINQRLRLDKLHLDDVLQKIDQSMAHAIFLALPPPSNSVSPSSSTLEDANSGGSPKSRSLRSLVSYLKEKDAAGVVPLSKDSSEGSLYAFPPCEFSRELLARGCPLIRMETGQDPSKDEHLVIVVIKNGPLLNENENEQKHSNINLSIKTKSSSFLFDNDEKKNPSNSDILTELHQVSDEDGKGKSKSVGLLGRIFIIFALVLSLCLIGLMMHTIAADFKKLNSKRQSTQETKTNFAGQSSCSHFDKISIFGDSDPGPKIKSWVQSILKSTKNPPKDCLEIQIQMPTLPEQTNFQHDQKSVDPGQGNGQRSKSSQQKISPLKDVEKEVVCDFETDGGGWTIIQQRMPGGPHAQFYRDWEDYEQGFGSSDLVNGSFWLGLKTIRALTADTQQTLRIELTDWTGETRWAEYQNFEVGPAKDFYRLWISGYSGNAGDSLKYSNGQAFSTFDRDNDERAEENCARSRHAGWFFDFCSEANLNGLFWGDESGQHENIARGDGIVWYAWKGPNYSLKKAQMKIRPTSFNTRVHANSKNEA